MATSLEPIKLNARRGKLHARHSIFEKFLLGESSGKFTGLTSVSQISVDPRLLEKLVAMLIATSPSPKFPLGTSSARFFEGEISRSRGRNFFPRPAYRLGLMQSKNTSHAFGRGGPFAFPARRIKGSRARGPCGYKAKRDFVPRGKKSGVIRTARGERREFSGRSVTAIDEDERAATVRTR